MGQNIYRLVLYQPLKVLTCAPLLAPGKKPLADRSKFPAVGIIPTGFCSDLFACHREAQRHGNSEAARPRFDSSGPWIATPQVRLAMTNGSEHLPVGITTRYGAKST